MLDLWVAPYFASTKALSAQALSDWVQRELLGAVPHAFTGFQRAVEAFEAQLNIESSLPATAEGPPGSPSDGSAGDGAGKMALARRYSDVEAGIDSPSAEPLRISSRLLEERLRRKFSRLHVNARLAELQALQQAIEGQRDSALSALAVLRHSLTGRVWPPAAILDPWLSAHELNVQTCESLLYRLEAVASGFANLPLDADSEAPPALAIAWDELAEA